MASKLPSAKTPPLPPLSDSPRHSLAAEERAEETKGLLSGLQTLELEQEDADLDTRPRRRRNWAVVGGALVALILGATFLPSLFGSSSGSSRRKPHPLLDATKLRSNGTHDFRRTVLMVSIDGLRAEYLDRGLTPHLLEISKHGLRAKYMQPIFPTLTFPNHWALLTGLYAESHGIVANNFWDPETKKEFHYNSAAASWNASWWLGEPIWETADRAGLTTANLMWPGPPVTSSGATPTYFVPWRDKVPLTEKLDQIVAWIDMPLDDRPQLILAYEPSLDQAGHKTGPNSALVNRTLSEVDVFARDLHTALVSRNLTEIVDVVFVSDHGMTDTSHPELIYIDDILGDGFGMIEHEDGWPSMGLRFRADSNASYYLDLLRRASAAHPEAFDVYTKETMPERYHFARHPRIAPIYIVPRIGYALTTRLENGAGMTKGNHGYDNADETMHAMFVAHGPFSAVAKALHHGRRRRGISLPSWLSNPNKGWHSIADDVYIMDGFQNVEIYGLVARLLGIQNDAARTNGTAGFWEKYF